MVLNQIENGKSFIIIQLQNGFFSTKTIIRNFNSGTATKPI